MEVFAMSGPQYVSLPAKCVDQLVFAAVLELSPQARYVYLDHVTETLPVKVVEMFEQLGLGYDRTRPVRQILQDAVFHCRQRNQFTLAAHGKVCRADLDVANFQDRGALSFTPPDERLRSR